MELPTILSGLNSQNFSLKTFLTFFPKKSRSEKFSYFSGNGTPNPQPPKNSLYFRKMEFSSSLRGNFLILQETETPRKLFIFSQKEAFLIFEETETPKKKFYISVNETFLCGKSSNKCRNSFKLLPPINASPKIRKSL